MMSTRHARTSEKMIGVREARCPAITPPNSWIQVLVGLKVLHRLPQLHTYTNWDPNLLKLCVIHPPDLCKIQTFINQLFLCIAPLSLVFRIFPNYVFDVLVDLSLYIGVWMNRGAA